MSDKIRSLKRIMEQKGSCLGIICEKCYFFVDSGYTSTQVVLFPRICNFLNKDGKLITVNKILREEKLKRILKNDI